jgi:hypothetical protein
MRAGLLLAHLRMLYTVLGLYDPAELAIGTCCLFPHTTALRALADSIAPSRMPVDA